MEAIPVHNPMTQLDITKENFQPTNQTVDSNIIRPDGAIVEQYLVGQSVTGGFSFEMAGVAFDAFIQGVLRGTFDAGTGLLTSGVVATPSFQFEKQFLDIAQFLYLRGCSVSDLSLTVASRAIVTGDVTFMGTVGAIFQSTKASASADNMTPAITNSAGNPSFTSGPGVANILVNGSPIGVGVKQIKLDVKNNLREREVVDSLWSRKHGRGDLDITGSLDLYFTNAALYNYFLANTALSLSFSLSDQTGFTYLVSLPKIKASSDNAGQIGGKNQDIMETFSFRALYDPTTTGQIQVTKSTI